MELEQLPGEWILDAIQPSHRFHPPGDGHWPVVGHFMDDVHVQSSACFLVVLVAGHALSVGGLSQPCLAVSTIQPFTSSSNLTLRELAANRRGSGRLEEGRAVDKAHGPGRGRADSACGGEEGRGSILAR